MDNIRWIFSGIGVLIITLGVNYFIKRRRSNGGVKVNETKVRGNKNIVHQIINENKDGSNVQIGSGLNEVLQNTLSDVLNDYLRKNREQEISLTEEKKINEALKLDLEKIKEEKKNIENELQKRKRINNNPEINKVLELVKAGDFKEAEKYLLNLPIFSDEKNADFFYFLGRFNTIKPDFKKALVYFKIAMQLKPDSAFYYNAAGLMEKEIGNYNEAIVLLKKALELTKIAKGEENEEYAGYLSNLGLAYKFTDNFVEAHNCFNRAYEIDSKIFDVENSSIARDLDHLAQIYLVNNDFPKAIEFFSRALDMHKRINGEVDWSVSHSLVNLGIAYSYVGEFDLTLKNLLEALEINNNLFGIDHYQSAILYHNIGIAYYNKMDLTMAIYYLEKAVMIRVKVIGKSHRYTQESMYYLKKFKDESNSTT